MYGAFVSGLSEKNDRYGFVDEREIRIATGITLILGLFSFFLVLFRAEFDIPLFMVGLIVCDFLIKVIISPAYSLFGNIVRPFLTRGEELWVGAIQKRFAWSIGIFLSIFVLYCLLLLGGHIHPMAGAQAVAVDQIQETIRNNIQNHALLVTPMNPAIFACLLCIVFMWLESVAGYCVGCRIYAWLMKKGWMKEHKGQNCVGGVCEVKE